MLDDDPTPQVGFSFVILYHGARTGALQRRNLGEMLLAANLIDEVQMEIALAEQVVTGKKFGSTLVDLKFIDENVLAAFLSRQIDLPCISLLHIDIPKKVLRRISPRVARECQAIPVRIEENRIEVAMVDPTDIDLITTLEKAAGMSVSPLIAPQSSIEKMIRRFYPLGPEEDHMVAPAPISIAADPMFIDLIEELENGDFDGRLMRIETNLGEIWTLLERILRKLESQDLHGERVQR